MVAELVVNNLVKVHTHNLVKVHTPSEVHENILSFVLLDEWHPDIHPEVRGAVKDRAAAHSFFQTPFSTIYKMSSLGGVFLMRIFVNNNNNIY